MSNFGLAIDASGSKIRHLYQNDMTVDGDEMKYKSDCEVYRVKVGLHSFLVARFNQSAAIQVELVIKDVPRPNTPLVQYKDSYWSPKGNDVIRCRCTFLQFKAAVARVKGSFGNYGLIDNCNAFARKVIDEIK